MMCDKCQELQQKLTALESERAAIVNLFTNVVNGGFHYRHVKPLAEALGVPLLNRQQVAEHVADKRDAQTVALLAEMAQGDGD